MTNMTNMTKTNHMTSKPVSGFMEYGGFKPRSVTLALAAMKPPSGIAQVTQRCFAKSLDLDSRIYHAIF